MNNVKNYKYSFLVKKQKIKNIKKMAKKVRWGPHLYILLSAGLKSTRTQLSSKLTSLHLLINIPG